MTVAAVRDEDYATGFGIQKGLTTGANTEFTFGKNELGLHKFHSWVDYYTEGKPDSDRPFFMRLVGHAARKEKAGVSSSLPP